MPIYRLGENAPQIDPQSWVAANATLIGQVVLSRNASIWWNATLRGDKRFTTKATHWKVSFKWFEIQLSGRKAQGECIRLIAFARGHVEAVVADREVVRFER